MLSLSKPKKSEKTPQKYAFAFYKNFGKNNKFGLFFEKD